MENEVYSPSNTAIKISFLAFVFCLCTFSDKSSTIPLFYVSTVIYLFFCFIYVFRDLGGKIYVNACVKCNFVFLVILILSSIWQESDAYWTTRVVTLTLIILMSVLTVQWIDNKDTLIYALKVIAVANSLNCIYRLISGGFNQVLGTYTSSESLIVGANNVAIMCVVSCAISIYLFRLLGRKWFLGCAVLSGFVGMATGSRKAILGLVVIIVLLYIFKDKRYIRNICVSATLLFVVWIVFSNVDFFSYSYDRFLQLLGKSSKIDYSSLEREAMREIGFQAFLQKPLLGYGVGYSYTTLTPSIGSSGTYLHNNYIEVAVSLGIFGLISFYVPHLVIIWKCIRKKIEKNYLVLALSIIIAMLFLDYGAVMYFDKFYLLVLNILFCGTQIMTDVSLDGGDLIAEN